MMIQKQRSQEDSELYSQVEYISPVNTLCIPFLLQPPKGTNRKREAKSKCFISAQHTFMDVGGFLYLLSGLRNQISGALYFTEFL